MRLLRGKNSENKVPPNNRIMIQPDLFQVIASEHYEALLRFAMSLTRQESDARDLTQQTFYIWATKGHQLRDLSKVKTWLFTTLHRLFLVARRRQSRFLDEDITELSEQTPALRAEPGPQPDGCHVLAALARVDEVYRAALALFYLRDCSYKEIAEILAVPVGTVKSRIARGILQLRAILGFVELEPPAGFGSGLGEMQSLEFDDFDRSALRKNGTKVPLLLQEPFSA